MIVNVMKVRKILEVDVPGLGARIKQAREADSRPLTQICAAIGMTTANWYKIEAEDTKILPLQTLRKIEQVLGLSFEVKFDDQEQIND